MSPLINKCLACNSKNCINFIDKEKIFLFCDYCKSMFANNEFKNNLSIEKSSGYIKSKFILKIAEVNTSYYIKYLKDKTQFQYSTALDIGTRYGTFVKQLNSENIDAYGVKSNKKLSENTVTNKIMWQNFDSNFNTEKKYDLVCLTSLIFYIRDNFTLLKQAKNLLSENGILFIVTFNPSSTLIKNNLLRINKENSQMIFGRKIFESLEKSVGLKLIDYTTVHSNFYNELDTSRNKLLTFLKYYLKLKQPFTENIDGNQSFILLSKVSKD